MKLRPLDTWTTEIPGLVPWSWRPTTYKRYSSGVCRLYSFIEVEPGKREWILVAKRVGDGAWCGVPNTRAGRKALAELRDMMKGPR